MSTTTPNSSGSGISLGSRSMFSSSIPPATIQNSVSHKLTASNYALWRSQFVPLLNAYDVMGIVDGSYSSPPPLIENFEGENSGIHANPDYILWHRMDQLVLS